MFFAFLVLGYSLQYSHKRISRKPFPRIQHHHLEDEPEMNGGSIPLDLQVSVNGDINVLLDQIGNAIGYVLDVRKASRSNPDGGVWLSGVQDNLVYSAYFHPSRKHRTSVKPGRYASVFPSTKDWVPAGQWAVTYTSASRLGGNKAYYDTK